MPAGPDAKDVVAIGRRALVVGGFAIFCSATYARPTIKKPADAIRALLSNSEQATDYADTAIAIDTLLDPTSNPDATRALIARLIDAAQQMAGPNPTDAYKLAAVRKAIYVAGPWNFARAFAYDQTDPLGADVRNKLLSTYVRKRLGNCVSMPVLFLIVADSIGLNVRLATAPLHVFVRYRNSGGEDVNLEATSGGHAARNDWYRQKLPMSDAAITSGAYMRTLSRRESAAEMANTVVDMLIEQHRWQDAIEVADVILAINPRETYTMVKRGSAYAQLLKTEFHDRFPTPDSIPLPLRPRYHALATENKKSFHNAEALGWTDDKFPPNVINSN